MPDETNPEVTKGAGGEETKGDQQTLGWKTEIPESLRANEAFAPYKTKDEFWNGHIEAVNKAKDLEGRLAGAIPKLAENATDEQKAAYRAAIGVPEKVDDYEVELVEGMDNSLAPLFKQAAFELGMPKDMAKGLSAWWNKTLLSVVQAQDEAKLKAHNEAVENLKNEWGENANANAEAIKIAYEHIVKDNPAFEPFLKTEVDVGKGKKVMLGDMPEMRAFVLWIGKKMLPDTILQGNPPGGGQTEVKMDYPSMKT